MKNVLMLFVLLSIYLFADGITREEPITLPVERPVRPVHPIHPVRPIVNTGVVYQDNYYNSNYTSSCKEYIDILAKKDEEILALKSELQRLKDKEQRALSESLEKSYQEKLEAFDKRKSTIKTKSSMTISEEPTK